MSRQSAFFVTGTDTEVGKTFVTTALLQAARQQGLTTLAIKPVAAGCEETSEGLRNEDALMLQQAMTARLSYAEVNPVALWAPIAPHIAARHEGVNLSAQSLSDHCRALMRNDVDLVLIEGAGGWRVPLNDRENLSDLPKALKLPVILVVDMRLGCLNHALLTAEAIERDGLQLAGWVANQVHPQPMPELGANLETLALRLNAPRLGLIPHLSGAFNAAACLDLTPLLSD